MEEESRSHSKSNRNIKKEKESSYRGSSNPRHRSRSPRVRRDYEVGEQRHERRRRRSSDGDIDVPRKPRRRSSDGDLQIERHRRRDNERGDQWERKRRREGDEGVRREGRGHDEEMNRRRPRENDSQSGNARLVGRSSAVESSGSQDGQDLTVAAEQEFGLSGKLAAETNTYKGVVINYSEPEEARIPKTRWRLYGFKGEEELPTFYVHRQSAYLIGRDRRVCDMAVDHPSCSKQHAVLQYRLMQYERPDGSTCKRVRPYVIDLGSTNGTYINSQRIESARYYELKEQDMLKFGFSSREYILLHENSKKDEEADEQK